MSPSLDWIPLSGQGYYPTSGIAITTTGTGAFTIPYYQPSGTIPLYGVPVPAIPTYPGPESDEAWLRRRVREICELMP